MDKNSILKNSEKLIENIKNMTQNSPDMVYRELDEYGNKLYIVYNESMANGDTISNFVIRSISDYLSTKAKTDKLDNITEEIGEDENKQENKNNNNSSSIKIIKRKSKNNKEKEASETDLDDLLKNIQNCIAVSKVKKLDLAQDDIFYHLFSGFACIVYNGEVIAVEVRGNLDRSIGTPINENTVRGPKDAFTENYSQNIGLIRKRLKDNKLVLEQNIIGRRSKTKIGLLYVSDIARKGLINYIKKKLKGIDIDAILDSNYIVELMSDKTKTNFPTVISTERPDVVVQLLLQGRAAIVVENSPFVIIMPAFVTDFINNIEDYYQKDENVTFTKIIRYIAIFITIFTPAIYIALITFNQEAIPTDLLISFISQRAGVPFPAVVEACLMIISFEILREGDFRLPNAGGSALSIVGALILGEAAVSAGIVSPIMIIVIAITTISGLIFTDINMTNSLRTWRIIMLIFSGIAGLLGIAIGTLLLITKLCDMRSFTKAYTYPFAPINKESLEDSVLKRRNIANATHRPSALTDNLTKYKKKVESNN